MSITFSPVVTRDGPPDSFMYDPEIPVIMVTAIHDISTVLEAIRRGAYDYILKPFEKDQLFHAVGRALQHRRLIRPLLSLAQTIED
jgi:DNA-binding NtrC family response regulator